MSLKLISPVTLLLFRVISENVQISYAGYIEFLSDFAELRERSKASTHSILNLLLFNSVKYIFAHVGQLFDVSQIKR